MRLDYNLSHLINNYKDVDGLAHYDYVGSTIWIGNKELCKEVSEFLGMEISVGVYEFVTREHMESVHKLLEGRTDLIGTYGDEFLNEW